MGLRSHLLCCVSADTAWLPPHPAEWLAINAPVPSSGWVATPVRRGGGVSNEAEFPRRRGPEEGSAERGLERGGVRLRSEGDPLPSGEVEM